MSEIRQKILSKITRTESLPTLPSVVYKIQEVAHNANSDTNDMVHILNNDPSIVSRILKTANSAFYAKPGEEKITDIEQAVSRLGFKDVQTIALSTGVFSSFDKVSSRIFDRKSFWKHCICTSYLSMEMAAILPSGSPAQPDILHLSGLIHDLGKILLDTHFPDLLEECIRAAMQTRQPLFAVEQSLLGVDHTEIGALLVKKWNLPEVAASVVRFHHDPLQAPPEHQSAVQIVHLANYLANTQDLGTGGDIGRPVFQHEAWESLQLSPVMIPELVRKVVENESDLLELVK
ncbi:MAG: HDOD domain-containing protein [Verrucomicrobiae bacterium]|nr:HDOD domain-containing protein [Verrucomicrobiae bacterium]